MFCSKCHKSLDNIPRIVVGNSLFCFNCAKAVIQGEENSRSMEMDRLYNIELKGYLSRKDQHKTEHENWKSRKDDFVGFKFDSCWPVIICFATLIYICTLMPGNIGLITFFCAPVLWIVAMQYIVGKRTSRFLGTNPEPKFDEIKPVRRIPNKVSHFIDLTDPWIIVRGDYRNKILKRDNYICQCCLNEMDASDLEVHHILPKSCGGPDLFENMITLCKFCHDRETWYGHKRAYPSTK